MMKWITAGQLRMARALLEWSQEDLAYKSRLSISTIRKMEEGCVPRASTVNGIRSVIEDAGLEFIDNEGIRRRFDVVQYRGEEGNHKFFDDIIRTLEKRGGEFLGYISSPSMLLKSFDITDKENLHRLEKLNRAAPVKCILTEPTSASFSIAEARFRILEIPEAHPSFFYVYGNKYAIILPREDGSLHFVVFELSSLALAYQKHFQNIWEQSLPIKAQRTALV